MLRPALYAVNAAALQDARLYAAAYAAATPARRQKADALRFAKDKYLSLGAGALLRHALREAGVDDFPAALEHGAQGKPYLRGSSVHFSLSHSGEWALCAVAGSEVGCDVEKIRPVNLKLARRFFSAGECADIYACVSEAEQTDRFFRYWTLKESFVKATGLGLQLPLRAFEITRGAHITAAQTVDGRAYSFAEFYDLPGCGCAMCAAEECESTALQILDMADLLPGE